MDNDTILKLIVALGALFGGVYLLSCRSKRKRRLLEKK
jgi:hypothetical protein